MSKEKSAEWYQLPAHTLGLHEWLSGVLELSDDEVKTAHDSLDGEVSGDTMDYIVKFAELGWTTERIYVALRKEMGSEFLGAPVWIHMKMCAAAEHSVRTQGIIDRQRPENLHPEKPRGIPRDWKKQPIESYDDAVKFAQYIAEDSCEHGFIVTGQYPHTERRGNSIFIVWPDGEETNEIEITDIRK